MPDHVSGSLPAPLAHDDLHQCAPKLDRLMALRDAPVALNGPLASDPQRRENLRKRLLSAEVDDRVLGKRWTRPDILQPV